MDLSQLQAMGLVRANPLVERKFKVKYRPLLPKEQWSDPDVEERGEEIEGDFTVWLRRFTAADDIAMATAKKAGRDASYVAIHRSCCKESGELVFPTYEDAVGLDLAMFAELVAHINEVNGGGKKSRPRTRRGVSSPSPSADDPSPNGKAPSPGESGESGSSSGPNTAP